MRLIIFVAVIALASAYEEDVKDKRQVLLGGLGYGGLGYGGLGYGLGYGLPYGGFGYGLGGYPAVIGRKRREVAEETDESTKEKRQLLLGGYGLGGYGLGYGGLGYGLPYGGFGYGLGGYPAVIGRKRRDVAEETDESTKEKRQLLLGGYGLGGYGLGYGGLGYGLPYGGFGYGLGGYPAVIGRKRRDVAEEESTKEKRQLLLGGYGLGGYGLGYGLPVGGYGLGLGYGLGGFPAVYGRKRRDVDEAADKAAHGKRQLIGAYPAVGGVLPVGGVVGAYPGVVGAYPGVVGAYPGVVGGYPLGGVVGGYPGVGIGAPGVIL